MKHGMKKTDKEVSETLKFQKGLTFIELIISISILMLLLFFTYKVYLSGLLYYKTTVSSTKLMKLAQGQLEKIVASGEPVDVTQWTDFSDRLYQYMIQQLYKSDSMTYDITLTARGPLDSNYKEGPMTKTIVISTVMIPNSMGRKQH